MQPGSRGHGCGMLSPEPERGAALAKTPPRSGPPASAICTEPKGGSNKGSRREEEEEEEGGPKQTCPTTHFGRKQSSVGSVSAQETSCGKVRRATPGGLLTDSSKMRKGRVETERKE